MNFAITGAELKLPNVPQSPNAGPTLLRAEMQAATALGRETPEGRVVYPGAERVLFLPERPYVPPATLRELVVRHGHEHESPDADLIATLESLGLGSALRRVGGLRQHSAGLRIPGARPATRTARPHVRAPC